MTWLDSKPLRVGSLVLALIGAVAVSLVWWFPSDNTGPPEDPQFGGEGVAESPVSVLDTSSEQASKRDEVGAVAEKLHDARDLRLVLSEATRRQVESVWYEATADLRREGQLEHWVDPPPINPANAERLLREYDEFREKLMAVYLPFASLASEKARLAMATGVNPGSERPSRSALPVIWEVSRGEGAPSFALRLHDYEDLDRAYAAYEPFEKLRRGHYDRLLDYFSR